MKRTIRIAPSILAADFLNLSREIALCEQGGADLIHCDVMDGHFVPNLTFGSPLIRQLHRTTKLELDVHLMIEQPERSLDQYREAGAAMITVHQEVSPHLHRTLAYIRSQGAKAGVSINPSTPIESVKPLLGYFDLLLIMSVNPGFGGQNFLPQVLSKIETASAWREAEGLDYAISVDGGIDPNTTPSVVSAGANVLVAGTAVFKGNVVENIRRLREAAAC